MAVVHRAELTPSKLDLLADWLPTQGWFADDGPIERVASFRFDDPAGQVGIETFVVRSGMFDYHVPLTYRPAPLPDAVLVGELEHPVLGHRWVYDGGSDPVYVAAATEVILTAGRDVDMFFADGEPAPRHEWVADARGSGTTVEPAEAALVVARALPATAPLGAPTLVASGGGLEATVTLAWLA